MDLAQAFAAPEPVRFGGREFPVRQLSLAEWAPLQAWLKTAVPSPITQVLRAVQEAKTLGIALDPTVRDAAFGHAQDEARRWPPAFGGRAWLAAVDSVPGGAAHFLAFVLRHAGTELLAGEAQDLVDAASPDEMGELVRAAYYGDPPRAPKAAAPATTAAAIATPATTGARPSTP